LYYKISDEVSNMFTTEYSEKGTGRRKLEEQAYVYFTDFLDECEGKLLHM